MLLHFAAVSVRGSAAGPRAPSGEEEGSGGYSPAASSSPRSREKTQPPPHAVFLRASFDGGGGGGNANANANASASASSSAPSDAALAAFCLPLGADHQAPLRRMAAEEFCFALTRGNGARVYGFCRRFLPPPPPPAPTPAGTAPTTTNSPAPSSTTPRYPAVLCLLSPLPWGGLIWRALEAVEEMLVAVAARGPPAAAPSSLPSSPSATTTLLHAQLPHADAPVLPHLPQNSPAYAFLAALSARLAERPPLGSPLALGLNPPPHLPADASNGRSASGVALSRLLWHVRDPRALTSLLASLLLERRVVFVARARDGVSAAALAASALLYPFRWRHLFLPILPRSFREYLTAPMPFVAGVPAPLLPALRGLPTERAVTVDLDKGSVTLPASAGGGEEGEAGNDDDGARLPWREELEAALAAALERMSSPTEHEVSGLVSAVVQGYLIRLLGGYRAFVRVGAAAGPGAGAAGAGVEAGGSGTTARRPEQLQRSLSARMPTSASACLLGARDPHDGRASVVVAATQPPPPSSSPLPPPARDASALLGPRGSWFDHGALVASHSRNAQARAFLTLLRGSQMYQAFVEERLARTAAAAAAAAAAGMAAAAPGSNSADAAIYERPYGEDDVDGRAAHDEVDPFEARVTAHLAAVRGRRGAGAATAAEAARRRQQRLSASPFLPGSPRLQQQPVRPMSALGGGGDGAGTAAAATAAAPQRARPRSAPPMPPSPGPSNAVLSRMAQALHRLVRRGEDGRGGGGKGEEKEGQGKNKDEQQKQQKQQDDEERRRRARQARLLARARAAAAAYARDASAGLRAGGGAEPCELEREARQAALEAQEQEEEGGGGREEGAREAGDGAALWAGGVSPVLDPTGLLPRAAPSRLGLMEDDEEAMILLLAAARPPAPPLAEESWGGWTQASLPPPPLPSRERRWRAAAEVTAVPGQGAEAQGGVQAETRQQQQQQPSKAKRKKKGHRPRQQQQEATTLRPSPPPGALAPPPAPSSSSPAPPLSHRDRLLLAVQEGFRAAAADGSNKSGTNSNPGPPGGIKSERA